MATTQVPPRPPLPDLKESLRLTWRLWMMLRPHWWRLVRGIWLGVVVGGVALVTPLVSRSLYDDAYPSRDYSLAVMLLLGTVVIALVSAAMGAIRGLYAQVIGARLSNEMNVFFAGHLLQLPVSFYDARRIGEVTNRNGDLQRALGFVTTTLQTVLQNGVYFVLVPPVLLYLEWRLALLSLIGLPFTTVVGILAGRLQRHYSRQLFDRGADATGFFYESLANIRTVKAASAEPAVYREIRQRAIRMAEAQRRSAILGIGVGFLNAMIRASAAAAYSIFGWKLMTSGSLTLGSFLAFTAYVGYLTGPVTQMSSLFVSLQQAAVSLGRFFEYVDEPIEAVIDDSQDRSPPLILKRAEPIVQFSNVRFAYTAGQDVLRGISMTLGSGITGVVGPSGGGKSSMVRLLLRFYAPQQGVITLGGHDIAGIGLRPLRRSIGTVFQEHGLLRTTILDNLRLGNENVSESTVADALSIVQMDKFIASLPDGLETLVSEGGLSLSAGQRQRISVARALIRKAPVLVLDEATSFLDPVTESSMLTRIIRMSSDTCILLITHRLATVRHVPSIYFLGDGTIQGGVAHTELMEISSGYRDFVEVGSGFSANLTLPASTRRVSIAG